VVGDVGGIDPFEIETTGVVIQVVTLGAVLVDTTGRGFYRIRERIDR
jgi:hypothetical protein